MNVGTILLIFAALLSVTGSLPHAALAMGGAHRDAPSAGAVAGAETGVRVGAESGTVTGAETPALARNSDVQEFCENPLASICGADGARGRAYDVRSAVRVTQIREAAAAQIAARFQFLPPTEAGYNAYAKAHPAQESAMLQAFMDASRSLTLKAVGESRLEWQDKIEQSVQSELSNVISAQTVFSDSVKSKLQDSVLRFELVDVGQVIRNEKSDPDLFAKFIKQCGGLGLRDNAFQPPGSNFLVLCPGMMLAGRADGGRTADTQDMASSTLWTLAHETGHLADITTFPNELMPLQNCIDTQFAQKGALKGLIGLQHGSVEWNRIFETYMEEIDADTWANEVLARVMTKLESPVKALEFLRTSSQSLCGMKDWGSQHPSGDFRLGILLGRNPRVRGALGCKPLADDRPVCSLEGLAH